MTAEGAHRPIGAPAPAGRRILVVATLAAALVAAAVTPPRAEAVVVCQRKKKVRLRQGPECKKKEQRVADLAVLATAGAVNAAEEALRTRAALLESEVGLRCLGSAMQGVATGGPPVPAVEVPLCRQLDGDRAACEAAYEFRSDLGLASSCFYYVGRCLACNAYQGEGACVDACRPPTCPLAPDRVFRGETSYGACEAQKTQTECETSFARSLDEGPVSCRWLAAQGRCEACDLADEDAGECVNACGSVRTTCTGRPGPERSCSAATTATDCEQRWEDRGIPTSCYWNSQFNSCNPCFPRNEFIYERCKNTC